MHRRSTTFGIIIIVINIIIINNINSSLQNQSVATKLKYKTKHTNMVLLRQSLHKNWQLLQTKTATFSETYFWRCFADTSMPLLFLYSMASIKSESLKSATVKPAEKYQNQILQSTQELFLSAKAATAFSSS